MPTPSASDRLRADHADALFVVAQLASADSRTAAEYVTSILAETDVAFAADGEEERRLLVRALLNRIAQADGDADVTSHVAQTQLARVVGERLPVVLSGLDRADRVLLGMRLVQLVPPNQVAGQLGVDEADVIEHQRSVTERVRDALLSGAAPYEVDALGNHLTHEALSNAIGRTLGDDLQSLPPSLRASQPEPSPTTPEPQSLAPKRSNRFLLAGYLALAVAITLLTVYAVTRMRVDTVETDAVSLAVRQAAGVELIVETTEPERATQFAHDHSGFSFALPTLDGYQLRGVTLHELVEGVSIPAFGFTSDADAEVMLFTFPYSLLDRAAGRLTLDHDTRSALEAPDAIAIHSLKDASALVWRHRDDVFVAVTDGDADMLRDRITW